MEGHILILSTANLYYTRTGIRHEYRFEKAFVSRQIFSKLNEHTFKSIFYKVYNTDLKKLKLNDRVRKRLLIAEINLMAFPRCP